MFIRGHLDLVKEYLDDADYLLKNERLWGALLLLLVAVAATSRKRYPRSTHWDNEAFKQFVRDEIETISCGAIKKGATVYYSYSGKMHQ